MDAMELLWPLESDSTASTLSDTDLLSFYSYPEPLNAPYIRANLASTVNGNVAAAGQSAGIASHADRILFGRLRRLADVILVGAETVRAEDCRGARKRDDVRAFRLARGQSEVPPVAVVSASANLRPDSRLFTDTYVPPIVLTTEAAPKENVSRLRAAGGDVLIAGETRLDIDRLNEIFAARGLMRVLCEGGPTLLGSLIAARAVDELCLTITPFVGGAQNLSAGPEVEPSAMQLVSVLTSEGSLLLRYRRDDEAPSPQRAGK
ncbi:pyrimidine reductase family protein [Micromonospora sp. bgisy143]|uniref:pyrimidine reductase family protein n=1 Tax=Micromonospora sp. bgisy143 TaxID=3413790 RepID=UPI003EB806E7